MKTNRELNTAHEQVQVHPTQLTYDFVALTLVIGQWVKQNEQT